MFAIVIDVSFVIDLVSMFFTPIQTEFGILTYDKKLIAISYLKFWFWIDFVSTVPFDLIATWADSGTGGNEATWLNVAELGRGFRLFRLV